MSNKSLPTVTSDIPRDLRTFLDRVRELLGSSGTDRFVTAKELASTGVVGTTGTGALVNPANVVQVSTPANPGVLTVSAAIQNIIIEWGAPRYSGHAYAEVWANGTNNLGTAVKVGVAPGNSYVDSVGPSVSRYYWVRFVSVANVEGPFNSVNGTLGETGPAVSYMLETLTNAALDPNSPYSKFAVRADLFYVAPDLDFNQEATPTATATGQLWYKPSTQVTTTWTGSAWGTFSTTLPFIVNSVPQTINGVAVPAGVYMDAAFIQNGTITNAKIGNATIDDAKIASLSAAKITSGFIDAARIQAGSLDAKIANIDAAVIGSGTINSARIGNLSANSITSGTLSVDRLSSGTSATTNGGTFGLGGTSTLNGFTGVGRFARSTEGFTLVAFQDNPVDGAAAVGSGTLSYDGWGAIGYNATNSNWNSFRTVGALGNGNQGILARYLRNIGTAGNASNPRSATGAGMAYSGTAGYFEYNGASGSFPYTTAHLGDGTWGGIFRNLNGGGIASSNYITELLCGGPTYSAAATKGVIYSVDGFLPFTGVHDGVVDSNLVLSMQEGDILVDSVVLAHLDVSNSIVKMEMSSTANQKGVIGVFVRAHAEAPMDWATHMPKSQTINDPMVSAEHKWDDPAPTPNPQYFDLEDKYKVVNVNALGEGQINVCGEGGTIEKGDLIVTSSMPGKGMKQADDLVRNITVAKARETVTFSSPTEVKQIACIYMCG